MPTERSNEESDEASLEKSRCSDAPLDAELDDEVEKELREFELLKSGLFGVRSQQQNVETVAKEGSEAPETGNFDQNNGCGSDMEVDEDLEREIAEAKKKNPRMPLQKIDKKSLDGSVSSDIFLLPDRSVEEKLLGNDLLENPGIPGDGEEPCLDMEQVRLYKDLRATDPLNRQVTNQNPMKPWDDSTEKVDIDVKHWSTRAEYSKLQPRKKLKQEEEEKKDPDFFPSPPKRKSCSRGSSAFRKPIPSEKEHAGSQQLSSQNCGATPQRPVPPLTWIKKSPPKTQHPGNKLPQLVQLPSTKMSLQDVVRQSPVQTAAQCTPEIKYILRHLPETDTDGNSIDHATSFVQKETFVDPVLEIPIQPKSAGFEAKDAFVDSILKTPVQSKSSSKQNSFFRDPIFDNPKPSCSRDFQADRASTKLWGSREDETENRILETKQAKQKKVGNIPQHEQQYVRSINFDQIMRKSNQNILRSTSLPGTIDFPLSEPTPSEKVGPKQAESLTVVSTQHSLPKPSKHPAYMEFLKNSKSLLSAALCPENQETDTSSPQNQPLNARPAEFTMDITTELPVEYCVIERVMRRRFECSLLLDDETFELMGAGRPGIWCPELHLYVKLYDNCTWMAPCNELKRFYCWPCLFYSSKVVWSVTCDQQTEALVVKEIQKHEESPKHQESCRKHDAWCAKKRYSIIKMLLKNNFVDGTWSDENQEAIIMKGRPCPILDNKTNRKAKKDSKKAFEEFYHSVPWISGCTSSQKFYCWPCVLFCRSRATVEEYAYGGTIESAETAVMQHGTSTKHMDACLKLGKWEFDLKKKAEAINEEIEKTRDFLKYLVEVLCAEKKKINNSEFPAVHYVDSLRIMSEYNRNLKHFLNEKSKDSKISTTVGLYAPAILDSVEYFIRSGILDEINNSEFVSLIFDHSSGLSHKAILSIIARYVDSTGNVHERFVKLLNVGYNTPSNTLSDEVFQTITELQCRSTLVGFTYDGYLVKPHKIREFNQRVQKFCPNAIFFHYSEHSFNRVLKQTLSHVPACRSILQVVKELASFFESTPSARKTLLDIIISTDECGREDFWRSQEFIRTVFIYHAVIVEIMEKISENAREWKLKIVVQAKNFLQFFNDARNRFFITVIARIYKASEDLDKALDEDNENDLIKIASLAVMKIQKLGRHFENVLDSACSHLDSSRQKTRREMSHFYGQFMNVLQMVVKLITHRIIDQENSYFGISKSRPASSSTFYIQLKRRDLFLHNFALPSTFNSTRLGREIQFFRNASVFSGIDLPEIISQTNDYKMTSVLPEFFKFLQLALTVPKKLYDDPTVPAVRRISAYLNGKKELNSTDTLLWMEREFLANLQKEENFYGKVVDRVLSITKKDGFLKPNKKQTKLNKK